MIRHPTERLIDKADSAINQEDFDTLIDIYSDDAALVIKPGMSATGHRPRDRDRQSSRDRRSVRRDHPRASE